MRMGSHTRRHLQRSCNHTVPVPLLAYKFIPFNQYINPHKPWCMTMNERRYGLVWVSVLSKHTAARQQPTSGVLSFTANPVPPLTRTKFGQSGPSVQSQMARWISSTLSGTILVMGDSHDPAAAKDADRTSVVLSDDGS